MNTFILLHTLFFIYFKSSGQIIGGGERVISVKITNFVA